MKKSLILAVSAVLAITAAAFSGNANAQKTDYSTLWKTVNNNLNKNLPESAEKTLNTIEQKAIKEKNQNQQLKTIVYMQRVFKLKNDEEEKYIPTTIAYTESKLGQLDVTHKALLHSEIAAAYATYLDNHKWRIDYNKTIEGDISKVEMKYWDKATFQARINYHYDEALKDVETLKNAKTTDYTEIYKDRTLKNKNFQQHLDYETTLFEFLFHRAANYYKEVATADDTEGDTNLWWLPAKDFANADLGNNDNPLTKCLKIFQQLIAYNLEQGKKDVLLYNDVRRYEFVNGILKNESRYISALERLKAENSDNPLSTEISYSIAYSLCKQIINNKDDSTYHDNYRKAIAICDEAIAKFPTSFGAKLCRSLKEMIETPSVGIEIYNVQLPGEPIPAVLTYRNIAKPYYRIIKVTEKDEKRFDNLKGDKFIQELKNMPAVVEKELSLPAETDYCEHSTLIALPPLEKGLYYIVASTEKGTLFSKDNYSFTSFQVSGLAYVCDEQVGKKVITTLDRKTGKPVGGVTVELQKEVYDYKSKSYKQKIIATAITDAKGKAVINKPSEDNSYSELNLRKGDDKLLNSSRYNRFREDYSDNREYFTTKIYTDRAIYRPGQTVQYHGVVVFSKGGYKDLAAKYDDSIVFSDANYQRIASASFTTDEYGSFSGSFVIPTDRMNGEFFLTTKKNWSRHSFRVEEYKRPTFEVTFEKPKEQYKLGQDVTVHGDVKALAGFGLDDVEYSYRAVRKTSFPWKCFWWNYPDVEDEQVAHGKARTDENGKFAITFNLKPSRNIAKEMQPLFSYEIEVTATSRQGETRTGTFTIRAGYNEIAISTDLPSEIEKSDLGKYKISVSNLSYQPAKSRISRKIYRYNEERKISYFATMNQKVSLDRQLLSDKELDELFPIYSFYDKTGKTLVDDTEIFVDDSAAFYDSKTLKPGKYIVELRSLDDPLAVASKEFMVYDGGGKSMPYTTMFWAKADKTDAQPGEKIKLYVGSSANDVEVLVRLIYGEDVRLEKKITLDNSVQTISYTVEEQDRGSLMWEMALVKENANITKTKYIDVPFNNYLLNVKLATMRDKLSPGAEETWEVTVCDYKNNPTKAALLAGMYDASLDMFAQHSWHLSLEPSLNFGTNYFTTDEHNLSKLSTNYFNSRDIILLYHVLFNYNMPSDWPFFDFAYISPALYIDSYGAIDLGVVADAMELEDEAELETVKVTTHRDPLIDKGSPESAKRITAQSLENKVQHGYAFVKINGSETSGQATAPTLRENFNETAFFFPNLRTDDDGSATFSFTMPDALTRWRLMLLAYNKGLQTGSREYTFTSSKPMMIMADLPRYIYDNDTLWLVANVVNTGDEAVTPNARLEIFDAATMQPVNLLLSPADIAMEQIMPGRSKEVRWQVAAKHDLSLLAFRFTAYADNFSDAEQRLMPVLNSEVFMTQTLPITVKAETEPTLDFDAIANPASNERDYSLTLNFSTNPVWYAVQSLPYLANTKTDRAENAFYVFYANTLASHIASKIPNLLDYIKKWQIETPDALLSQLEKDQELKAIMLQETPWVIEAKSESEQRSRIAALFDLKTIERQQSNALKLLSDKQKYNGGWPWMEGMPESPYITTYILKGFGKLKTMGAWESLDKDGKNNAKDICKRAVRFLEREVAESYRYMKKHSNGKDWPIGSTTLAELYALSFFDAQNSDNDFVTAKKYYLGSLSKEWTSFNFNQRSQAAVLLWRNGKKDIAKLMIQSFKECAQKNEQTGMYWPKKYFSFESHIATHANIMAAFAEIDNDDAMLDQLRVWLLTQKQTNRWENCASTADAIYALLMRGSDWLDEGKEVTLRFGNTPVSTDGGVAGTGFVQRRWNADEVTPEMRHLTVNNPTKHLVWGGLFRQYFVPADEVKSDESGFTIRRELFVEKVTDKGKKLVPIALRQAQGTAAETLHVGDKVTVKITFTNEQDMSFVFVKDLRAAGFEPTEQVSRYRYNDGMSYYQSNTDSDMEFFIEFLPKGTHQLEYSMFVTKEGNLSNGYALIQCQYAPEFSAYSNGMKVKVGN
jgi:5-hydroxyisourate hydrolase-like protein (transthyretin family)